MLRLIVFSMVFLLSSSLTVFGQAYYAQFSGKVVSVYDGDTFTIKLDPSSYNLLKPALRGVDELNQARMRIGLIGIDSPELDTEEPYASQAKKFLSLHILNRPVRVMVPSKANSLLRSGNLVVGHVYLADTTHVSLGMLRGGFARDYPKYSLGIPAIASQWDAMNRRLGIWSDPVQYAKEDQYRQQLYGVRNLVPTIVPTPLNGGARGIIVPKPLFPNPNVGKNAWQQGFKNRIPAFAKFNNN